MNRSFMILIIGVFWACHSNNALLFDQQFDEKEYNKIAKEKGISNEKWIKRLFDYKVNINKYDEFKRKGIKLNEIRGKDYKSRVLLSDVIIEGEVISEKENANRTVMFHTEYAVKVIHVLKHAEKALSDTIMLKLMYGPIGEGQYMAVTSGVDKYKVGEQVILYLETMERTFRRYEDGAPENMERINADRGNSNIFRPLKKYSIIDGDIHERTNGYVEKKKKAVKEIRSIVKINGTN